ncbi:hypothetical protein A2U01_0031412, partial [Trifolium medium]|nr:hypothetical protein [Trifolium medium]
MDSNHIEKANAALARLKRRRSIENKTHFTTSSKRSLTSSTSSSALKTKSPLHGNTHFTDVTNTHQQQLFHPEFIHSHPTQNTQPSSTVPQKQQTRSTFLQTRYSGINLLNKFSATTYKQPSNSTANNDSNFTNPSPQQQPDSVPPSSQQQPDSATDTDSEIEIYLDEDSSSDSEPDMENDHRAFRNNMSHTITGNSALQGYDDLGDALCECEECGAYM